MNPRLLIILSVLVVWSPNSSYASSCAIISSELAAKKAKVIFMGVADSVDVLNRSKYPEGEYYDSCGDKFVTFTPLKIWKGNIDSDTTVYSSDGCVGLGGYFEKGKEYLIYASEAIKKGHYGKGSHQEIEAGQLYTTVCGRSSILGNDNSNKDLEYLNKNFKINDRN